MSTNRKLNMDHGFMQSIIKNQMARDNYDKEMKCSPKNPVSRPKNKKPDVATYIPPKRPKDISTKTCLFVFEYEDIDGCVHTLHIHQEDDIGALAHHFAQERGLTESMTMALSAYLKTHAREYSLAS